MLTFWGAEKNPRCKQNAAFASIHGVYEFVVIINILFQQHNIMFGPGLGVMNAAPSGKLYYGSEWNQQPVPRCDHTCPTQRSCKVWASSEGIFKRVVPCLHSRSYANLLDH